MGKTPERYYLILCGGTGPRLWPLSRATHPKPFLPLFSNTSLLKLTYQRLHQLAPNSKIFFVSNAKYLKLIKKELPANFPSTHIIVEPQKKNTLMAILLACHHLAKINPDSVVSVFPSDHLIDNLPKFKQNLESAQQLASEKDQIVTFGITPTRPHPAYGYIVPRPLKFVEKPSPRVAQKLISSGALWNSGIYTFKISSLLQEVSRLQPEYHQIYQQLHHHTLTKMYLLSPNLSIDTAISEKSKKIVCLKANFTWSDVGDWKAVYDQLPKAENDISSFPKTTKFLSVNSEKCLVSAPQHKLIGLVGVSNLAIIDTDDALLICNLSQDQSFHVRDLVGKIVAQPVTAKYFLHDVSNKK